jgi:hypothetical protein
VVSKCLAMVWILVTTKYNFLLSSRELSPFYLTESLSGSIGISELPASLLFASEPRLSKMSADSTWVLLYHSRWSDNQDSYQVTVRSYRQHGFSRQRDNSRPAWDKAEKHKISSCYSEHDLKLMMCLFLEFSVFLTAVEQKQLKLWETTSNQESLVCYLHHRHLRHREVQ